MKNETLSKQNKIILSVTGILLLGVIVFAFVNKGNTSYVPKPSIYDGFAQCLTEKGATMYGASWCKYCQAQKKVFGDAFRFVNYVECPDNVQFCIDKGIQGYPTWLIGSSTVSGFSENSTMKELSEISGCPLPEANL